jgi:hypothetical protein
MTTFDDSVRDGAIMMAAAFLLACTAPQADFLEAKPE